MTENFPQLMKDITLHSQEAQQTLSRINSPRSTPRYIVFKRKKNFFNITEKNIREREEEAINIKATCMYVI